MSVIKKIFPLALVFACVFGLNLPLPGQVADKGDKKDDPKDVKKDDKKTDDKKDDVADLVFKGELKPGSHPFKLTAGQVYYIKIKSKNFRPFVQIRNAQTNQIFFNQNGGTFDFMTKENLLTFPFNAPTTDVFNIQIMNQGAVEGPGPLDYSIEVNTLKLLLSKTEQLANTDPHYAKVFGPQQMPQFMHYAKSYTIALKAGVSYQFDLSGPITPYLALEDAAGQLRATAGNGSGGINKARLIFTVPQNAGGDYKIIATTQGANITGQFTLTVNSDTAN